jgi:hypothetical protein
MNAKTPVDFPVYALLGDNLDVLVEKRFESPEEASAFMDGVVTAVEAQSSGQVEFFDAAPGVVQVLWDDENITKARLHNRPQALAFAKGIQDGGGEYRVVFVPDESYDYNFKTDNSESREGKPAVDENWIPSWYVNLLAAPSPRSKMAF